MSVPTKGETFGRLTEYLRRAQEEAAMLAHLANAQDDRPVALAWLRIEENLKKFIYHVTQLATKGLQ